MDRVLAFLDARPDEARDGSGVAEFAVMLTRARLGMAVAALGLLALATFPRDFVGLMMFYTALLRVFVLALVVILTTQAIRTAPSSPFREFLRRLKAVPPRIFGLMVAVFVFLSAFTTFKTNIPHIVPFYADPWFADLDLWLHGADPWRLLRALPDEVSIVVDRFYSQLWFAIALGVLFHGAVYASPAEFRRLTTCTFLVYTVLGLVAATALASVGPVFYDRFYTDQRFVGLTADLAADIHAVGQKLFIDYLYTAAVTKAAAVGTGISAMPSIHVAVAVTVAWYLTSLGRTYALVGWTFTAIILFGSIYTGWHYAVDGYLSLIASSIFWIVLSRFHGLGLLGRGGKLRSQMSDGEATSSASG